MFYAYDFYPEKMFLCSLMVDTASLGIDECVLKYKYDDISFTLNLNPAFNTLRPPPHDITRLLHG